MNEGLLNEDLDKTTQFGPKDTEQFKSVDKLTFQVFQTAQIFNCNTYERITKIGAFSEFS